MSQKLIQHYLSVRKCTEEICRPLTTEDYTVQAALEVSPPKWHLAHSTWFFETFILKAFMPNWREVHPSYAHIFNSYYKTIGQHWLRSERGNLSRPTVKEVYAYRKTVDIAMQDCMQSLTPQAEHLIKLGLHHEQQHQELLLMDIKFIFARNIVPTQYKSDTSSQTPHPDDIRFKAFEEKLFTVGHSGPDFSFDNEVPAHKVFIHPFALADRLSTNAEYLGFIEDKGYSRPELWLSDGWDHIQKHSWTTPLYWNFDNNIWKEYTFQGLHPLDFGAPVSHLSFYEADAFARWKKCRLPTEFEWEYTSQECISNSRDGFLNLSESGLSPKASSDFKDQCGHLWQWTNSSYLPYPGYKQAQGNLGEYNGKFMCNQKTLRGGSFATPLDHFRKSYRNFFYPHDRWCFSGLRLAKEI